MIEDLRFKPGAATAAEPRRACISKFTVLGLGAYGFSAIGYITARRTMTWAPP